MGSKCSPSYANLFMGNFEDKFIYPKIENKSACYHCFIDDIFMVWTRTEEELLSFFEDITNTNQLNLIIIIQNLKFHFSTQ